MFTPYAPRCSPVPISCPAHDDTARSRSLGGIVNRRGHPRQLLQRRRFHGIGAAALRAPGGRKSIVWVRGGLRHRGRTRRVRVGWRERCRANHATVRMSRRSDRRRLARRFSVTVHRSEAPASGSADTATIVVYVGATAAKYPRSVTGDPYFDTSSVHLMYAPIGGPAELYPLSLRILFPPP
jgi:hypothetical protein